MKLHIWLSGPKSSPNTYFCKLFGLYIAKFQSFYSCSRYLWWHSKIDSNFGIFYQDLSIYCGVLGKKRSKTPFWPKVCMFSKTIFVKEIVDCWDTWRVTPIVSKVLTFNALERKILIFKFYTYVYRSLRDNLIDEIAFLSDICLSFNAYCSILHINVLGECLYPFCNTNVTLFLPLE